MTGGWKVGATNGGTASKDSESLSFSATNRYATFVPNNKINPQGYLKFCVKAKVNSFSGSPIVDIRVVTNSDGDSGLVQHQATTVTKTGELLIEYDISSVASDYYISIQPNSTTTSSTSIDVDFYEVWLE